MQSIAEYDYQPSMVYFSLLEGTPWFQSCIAANPSCLLLLRHAPLSNLYNSIAEVLNSFQDCPVLTAARGVVCLFEKFVAFCIRKLEFVKPAERHNFHEEIQAIEEGLLQKHAEREGSASRQAEFFVMCDILAFILIPIICRHISAIVSSGAPSLCEVT